MSSNKSDNPVDTFIHFPILRFPFLSTSIIFPVFLIIGLRYCDRRIGITVAVLATLVFFILMYKYFNDTLKDMRKTSEDGRGSSGGEAISFFFLSLGPMLSVIVSVVYTVILAIVVFMAQFFLTCPDSNPTN